MLFAVVIVILIPSVTNGNFWKIRESLIAQERNRMLGASIVLNGKEEKANNLLMSYKLQELDVAYHNPENFAPSKYFVRARAQIESSPVFKLIKTMPKGGALHGHSTALATPDFLYSLTYRDNLFVCMQGGTFQLRFMQYPDAKCKWTLISTLRGIDANFDEWLRSQFTMYHENDIDIYKNKTQIWLVFEKTFSAIKGLVTYRPIFEEYFYEVLRLLFEDNVMYLEFRSTLPEMYELNGSTYKSEDTVRFYDDVIEKFKRTHPKFVGARLIYAPDRDNNNQTFNNIASILLNVKVGHPKILAGFDLVGQEDLGAPLLSYLWEVKRIAKLGIDVYFHAGETNWYQSNSDYNVIDAILLGSKRIGHALGLIKHPVALEMIKERNIAIEVCPISNQMLLYVDDLRNHPASFLIANGFPIVISYDDPSLWNVTGLNIEMW
ncbi:adenosine deaminase 2-like [Photinus pyralis]|uniref:adenosine deaminase 2-like n=1 Tax=Photinus pyralis TaxID=7054 RepID=UPI0012674872|nr:adenosine deaminase 2-like [Photinus pyralis]